MEDWKSHIMTPNSEPLSILSAYMDRIIKYTRTSSAPGTTNHKLLITNHQSLLSILNPPVQEINKRLHCFKCMENIFEIIR